MHVVDEDGAPLADRRVFYDVEATRGSERQRSRMRGRRLGAVSDELGIATIRSVPCGMPLVVGVDDTWVDRVLARVDVVTRRGEITISPPAWVRLTGRLAWSDGAPAEGVAVQWVGTSGPVKPNPRLVARADGTFQFELRPGSGRLYVPRIGAAPLALVLAAGEDLDVGTIELERPVPLAGLVVGTTWPTSRGFEPLSVLAFRDGVLFETLDVDAEGTFAGAVGPGPLTLLLARGGWWEPDFVRPSAILATARLDEPRTGVELRLEARGGTLAGRVRGTPAGASVSIELFRADQLEGSTYPSCSLVATTREDGAWSASPVPPGRYDVRVALDEDDTRGAWARDVEVVLDAETDVGTLALGMATLDGRVVDANGAGVGGASVTARSAGARTEASTDAAGGFSLGLVRPGVYELSASAGGLGHAAPRNVALGAGERAAAELALAPLARLQGRLHAPDGPRAGEAIFLQRQGANRTWTAEADADGRFAFEPLEPGAYRAWSRRAFVANVELAAGETYELDVPLGGAATRLRITRGGVPFAATSLRATALARAPGEARLWSTGAIEGPGDVRVELPRARALLVLDATGIGNNQVFVATLDTPAEPLALARVELEGAGIELETRGAALHGPPPLAYLLSIDGHDVAHPSGFALELPSEHAPGGAIRYPALPLGARVRLEGHADDGTPLEKSVSITAPGWTRVAWP